MDKLPAEVEIFDRLSGKFRLAAEAADDLAKLPRKGPTYVKLRDLLADLETACRQVSFSRSDSRWLKIGLYMEECHKRAGGWLRGYKDATGRKITLRQGQLHPLFSKLAENLRAGAAAADRLRNEKTSRVGTILPESGHVSRNTSFAGWTKNDAGVFIPAGA